MMHRLARAAAMQLAAAALLALHAAGQSPWSADALDHAPHLTAGQSVDGHLTASSTRLQDGTLAEPFVYEGQEGERISVTLRSRDFDSFLRIYDAADPRTVWTDDDGGGNLDSETTIVLPHTGRYVVVATTLTAGATGAFTVGVANVRGGNPIGGSDAISRLAGMDLPAIAAGQTVRGRLSSASFLLDDETYAEGYAYDGKAGERITVTMKSTDLDAWLVIDDPNSMMREHDDNGGGGQDAQLTVTLPHDGRYVIVANTQAARTSGAFTLGVQRAAAATPAP